MTDFATARAAFRKMQDAFCSAFEARETRHRFSKDNWRSKLGKGRTYILQGGEVLEKAGIGFSDVAATELPSSARNAETYPPGTSYKACGLSVVIHPRNPYVPASHFNVRFFTIHADGMAKWWFGGGFDLTPYYPNLADCRLWHKRARALCQGFGGRIYEEYKNNCDRYFYLPHRGEMRGIGGLFFDELSVPDFTTCLRFARSLGDVYLATYLQLVDKNKDRPCSEKQRDFLCYRRGRYVEFNLLYDRGTRFGLESGGRAESILMSMPPLARWRYGTDKAYAADERRLKPFLLARDWCSE